MKTLFMVLILAMISGCATMHIESYPCVKGMRGPRPQAEAEEAIKQCEHINDGYYQDICFASKGFVVDTCNREVSG